MEKRLPTIVLFLFFCLFVILALIDPKITGYVIFQPNETVYIKELNLTLTTNSSIEIANDGELKTLALTGNIEGNGTAKIYFENLLVVNETGNCSCKFKIEDITVNYTGIKNVTNVSVYNKHGSKWELEEILNLINNTFTTEEIGKPETMFAVEDENGIENGTFHISDLMSNCSSINNNFSIIGCTKEQDCEKITCIKKNFTDECIETCLLPRGYNATNYNLTIEIGNLNLSLEKLSYLLYSNFSYSNNSNGDNQSNISNPIEPIPPSGGSGAGGGGSASGNINEIPENIIAQTIVEELSVKGQERLPEANCYDGIRNQGEQDIDCGGPCLPCENALTGRVIYSKIFGNIRSNSIILLILILILIYLNKRKTKIIKK